MKTMARYYILFVLAICWQGMGAQTYTALWKQYNALKTKDQPQSQLTVLDNITRRATEERSFGHLLKAEAERMEVLENISEDSLKSNIVRLKKLYHEALTAPVPKNNSPKLPLITAANPQVQNKVLAASYAALIGAAWQHVSSVVESERNDSTVHYFTLALQDPAALAEASTKNWDPGVVNGTDSRIFQDDMLHVVSQFVANTPCTMQNAQQVWQLMNQYYEKEGVRPAAFYTSLQLIKMRRPAEKKQILKKSTYIQSLDSLGALYKDLPEVAEALIARYEYMATAEDVTDKERINTINYALTHHGSWPRMNILRNAKSRMTMPSYMINLDDCRLLPNTKKVVEVTSLTNLQQLTMKIYPTTLAGDCNLSFSNDADKRKILAAMKPAALQQKTLRFIGLPEYQEVADTMSIEPLQPGVYVMELSTSNVSVPVEYMLINVSDLTVFSQKQPNGRMRIVVLNATTGQPVKRANVVVKARNGRHESVARLTTDDNGEVFFNDNGKMYDLYAFTSDDKAMLPVASGWNYFFHDQSKDRRHLSIYTDRSIYRPGQVVHAAIVSYTTYHKTETLSDEGKEVKLTLRDANNREVTSKTVRTDEYGKASADFVLPATGLTGHFSLVADNPLSYCNFRVEEYKLPTFDVAFDEPAVEYQEGDTVTITGRAKTFSGMPVANAKVAAKVNVQTAPWCSFYSRYVYDEFAPQQAVTDDDGTFTVKVPIELPNLGKNSVGPRFVNFNVTADVTSGTGETQTGITALPYSDRPYIFAVEAPQIVEKGGQLRLRFVVRNARGTDLERTIKYSFMGEELTADTNKDIIKDVKKVPSGKYTLQAICQKDTINKEIIIFSIDDKQAPTVTHNWYYASGDEFRGDQPVKIQFGSTDEQHHILYSVFSGNDVVEQGVFDLNNQTKTLEFTYKESYGDGILVTMAWEREGVAYTHQTTIKKAYPDIELKHEWVSFRDRLVPGQKEKWTLRLTDKEGKPAKASVLTTMYDASLDKIYRHFFLHNTEVWRCLPSTSWSLARATRRSLYGEMTFNALPENPLDFSHFCFNDFNNVFITGFNSSRAMFKAQKQMMATAAAPAAHDVVEESVASYDVGGLGDVTVADLDAPLSFEFDTKYTEQMRSLPQTESPRKNLNETAFFYPQLVANENGEVDIEFTLPESLTTWRIMALATDKQMRSTLADEQVVAQKELMVQPNMPRFVRKGDKLTVSAAIANLTEKRVQGTATLELLDPETEAVVLRRQAQFAADSAKTATATFTIEPTALEKAELFICRIMAKAGAHSDGEQHYLAVLPDQELVTDTYSFTMHEPGTVNIDLATQNKKNENLTIEYTSHPAWLMVQALPTVAEVNDHNAISIAAGLYATAVAESIINSSPAIKKVIELWRQEAALNPNASQSELMRNSELKTLLLTETPWLTEALNETEQRQMLQTYLDESVISSRLTSYTSLLNRLQNGDGSFSWWKGMRGNRYITTEVASMLARMIIVAPNIAAPNLLNRAVDYLAKKIADDVDEIKKELKKNPKHEIMLSDQQLHYLYITSIYNAKLSASQKADAQYMADLAAKHNSAYSIYGKANLAIILNHYNHADKAKELLESARQYSVYSDKMGRYYDTKKAKYSWRDYRIPTQVAVIEALKAIQPDDRTTVEEMQRWLLMEKRTQAWDTPINTVNAVHAFLQGNMKTLNASSEIATFKLDNKAIEPTRPSAAIGYTKTQVPVVKNPRQLTVTKTDGGTSWGAVYVQYMQDVAKIKPAGEGLAVKREIIIDGKAVKEGETVSLKVGDKIMVRLTITADHDYDFVQIVDKRAACMEPVRQLSGYQNGYYTAPLDNQTRYFADCMAKGTHFIETEYFIDRAGEYTTGTCTVQCAYSPEFSGRQAAARLVVE